MAKISADFIHAGFMGPVSCWFHGSDFMPVSSVWFHAGSMPSCAIYDGLSSEWNEWPCVPWDFDSYVAEFWRENWRPHKEEKEGGTKVP